MRTVLDTNQHVSAFINPDGNQAQILRIWHAGDIELGVSPPLVAEIDDVLHRPHIQQRYGLTDAQIEAHLMLLREFAVVVPGVVVVDVVSDDPDDNMIIACALEAEADVIISGDRHLLSLGSYRGIPIVRAADFLRGYVPS